VEKTSWLAVAILLAMATTSSKALAGEIFVATDGDDGNPGTLKAPFATVERARDEIRKLKASGSLDSKGTTVYLREGFYPLSKSVSLEAQDSGKPEAPICYRNYKDEKVQISGGAKIPASAFKAVNDQKTLERLDQSVRGKVLKADLLEAGVMGVQAYPLKFNGAPAIPELFFNDSRMNVARWPNEGWATIAKILDGGAKAENPEDKSLPSFEYSGDRPQRWNVDNGVWLLGYWCFDWSSECIKVKSIDTAQRKIELAGNHGYGLRQGNPSPRRYKAMNLLEELDEPGEYYIDQKANALYFLPPGPMEGAKIVLSTLNAPLFSLKDVSNVTIRGFALESGLDDAVAVAGGSAVAIQGCEARNLRLIGIDIEGGSSHKVESCDIHDTGEGGLRLNGGDRKTLKPGKHEALNNRIWLFAIHKLTYANGISLQGVGNRAAHNLLHDAPHQAIAVGGNDNVFEYNIVHDICTASDDAGAYYKGRNPSCRGNIVRYNFWYKIGSPMGHGNAAIYYDDGDCAETVYGNVFFRCGEPGKGSFGTIFSHGGHDILAENNVFIECKRALGSAPWNDTRWRKAVVGNGKDGWDWQNKLLKEVDITKPPYTTHYPDIVGFMDPKPGQTRINRAKKNLIVMCADVSSGSWQVKPEENLVTDADPGFVDAENGDFRLKPSSEVFKKLPGFQPIPFEKIGLYADALRPALPSEKWTLGAPKPLPPLPKKGAQATQPSSNASSTTKEGLPIFKVRKAAETISIDGSIDPSEWNGLKNSEAMIIAQNVGGEGVKLARQSKAWIAYDQKALYVAVDSLVAPETKLEGNEWGESDAIEISLRPVRKDGKANPITVLRGYGNGFLQYGTTPNADDEPNAMDPGGVKFKASKAGAGRWTAEFMIPFWMIDLEPEAASRIAFNLTVRKPVDDLWLMWQGTKGHSFDVGQAGLLELAP